MPVHTGTDAYGTYAQWGSSGKKYYYRTPHGAIIATAKATMQGKAIEASKNLKPKYKRLNEQE